MLMFSRRNHVTVGTPKLTQRSPSQEVALRPVDLQGKTLGVLGMGGIGQALAPRAKVMGMRVLGTSRQSRETFRMGWTGCTAQMRRSGWLLSRTLSR